VRSALINQTVEPELQRIIGEIMTSLPQEYRPSRVLRFNSPVTTGMTLGFGTAIGLLIAEPAALLVFAVLLTAFIVTVMSWYL
jgi:hypothetical protein